MIGYFGRRENAVWVHYTEIFTINKMTTLSIPLHNCGTEGRLIPQSWVGVSILASSYPYIQVSLGKLTSKAALLSLVRV